MSNKPRRSSLRKRTFRREAGLSMEEKELLGTYNVGGSCSNIPIGGPNAPGAGRLYRAQKRRTYSGR